MAVQLGSPPLADFDQPLQMLTDCHRRIEHFLGVLHGVLERFGGMALDEPGRCALHAALTYFGEAAPKHTADEEESLFPRLRRCRNSSALESTPDLDRLEADHREADIAHRQVDELGRRWLRDGRLEPAARAALGHLLHELSAIYDGHIRLEESRVFKVASRALSATELSEVGGEMKRRRGFSSGNNRGSMSAREAPSARANETTEARGNASGP